MRALGTCDLYCSRQTARIQVLEPKVSVRSVARIAQRSRWKKGNEERETIDRPQMVRNAAPAEAVTPIVRSIKERHPSQDAPQLRSQLRSAQAELVKEMMTAMATASSPSSPMPPPLLGSIVAQSKSLA